MGQMRNVYTVLVGTSERKRSLGAAWRRWESNMKFNPKEMFSRISWAGDRPVALQLAYIPRAEFEPVISLFEPSISLRLYPLGYRDRYTWGANFVQCFDRCCQVYLRDMDAAGP
jgi:hypothetical protein